MNTKTNTKTNIRPSTIKTLQMCEILWVYQNIVYPEKNTPSKSQQTGIEYHAQIANYLQNPRDNNRTEAVDKCVDFLDSLIEQPNLKLFEVEDFVQFQLLHSKTQVFFEVKGQCDYWQIAGNSLLVVDHKTCSTFEYCLSESELAKDAQLLIYAKAVLDFYTNKDIEIVELTHNYVSTKTQDSQQVTVSLSLENFNNNFEQFVKPYLERAYDLFTDRGTEVEGNLSTCSRYGGCKFVNECPTARNNRLVVLKAGLK